MENRNGKPSSALSDSVDYSRVLHNGVSQDVLESLLGEHDQAKQQDVSILRRQVGDLSEMLERVRSTSSGADGASDVRSEVAELRQEFATAMASLRGLLVEGDGDLHEMQLTSLRRQVSQLEGVLESNYQRELRVAEERESALRSEMAQMRQDLRVALETLYRMPAEAEGPAASDELKSLEKQVTELATSLVRVSDEQQRAAIERESTLKAELASMRRDLLVTLEASYQLPTDRVEGIDSQIASWRGQVEELQVVILGMREAQDEGAAQQRIALQTEMHQLGQQIQSTLEATLPASEHEELLEQRAILMQLAQRLDEQGSGNNLRYEKISEIVSEKSSALEGEFVALRAEVQVTMDALAARLDAVPASPGPEAFESLHQRLTDLQSVATSRDQHEVALAQERERNFAAEIASLKAEVQASVRELSTRLEEIPGNSNSDALHEIQKQLGDLQVSLATREDTQAALVDERQRAFAAALDEELASLRADIRSAVESISAEQAGTFGEHERETLLNLEPRLQQTVLDLQAGNERALHDLNERELALRSDIASLHPALAALAEAVSDTGSVDHSTDLQALHDSLATVANEIAHVREEQRALLSAQGQAVHEELAASQDLLLETSIAIREANAGGPALTVEAIDEIIRSRLGALEAKWNEAQTEQYRQLISHVSEIQVDLDNVSTVMQAVQPADNDASSLDSSLLEQVKTLLEALQVRAPEGNKASIDEFNRLRYEIQGLRSDLQAALQSESTRAHEGAVGAPEFTLDDVVRVIATQLNAGKAEDNRLATNRDNVLRHELAQIRQEMQSAVQHVRAAASDGGTSAPSADLSELHAELTQIRASLAREPDSHDGELRGELAQLRQDLRAVVDSLGSVAAQPSDDSDNENPLTERVVELELALRRSHEEQRRWLEERDAALQAQFGELRTSLISAVSDAQPSYDKSDDDAWSEELIRLHSEIAALTKLSETREAPDDSPVIDLVAALRIEMRQALQSLTASNALESTNSPGASAIQDGLAALAASMQQSSANQERVVESQRQSLQATITQLREEMRSALSGLSRESMDTFEKRQSQLRMDQLEMERNLAKLRQELVTTQADPSNKKKLWR